MYSLRIMTASFTSSESDEPEHSVRERCRRSRGCKDNSDQKYKKTKQYAAGTQLMSTEKVKSKARKPTCHYRKSGLPQFNSRIHHSTQHVKVNSTSAFCKLHATYNISDPVHLLHDISKPYFHFGSKEVGSDLQITLHSLGKFDIVCHDLVV